MRKASPSRRLLIAGLAFTAVMSGCTSPPSRRFLLAPRGAATAPSYTGRVAIAGVGVAKYLDQPEIVRHGSGYELAVAEFEVWGEGMADMVGRVLAEDLTARLPGGTVFVGDGDPPGEGRRRGHAARRQQEAPGGRRRAAAHQCRESEAGDEPPARGRGFAHHRSRTTGPGPGLQDAARASRRVP